MESAFKMITGLIVVGVVAGLMAESPIPLVPTIGAAWATYCVARGLYG